MRIENDTSAGQSSAFSQTLSQHQNKHQVVINDVPIDWDLDKGKLQFFGIDSAMFWTNSSLSLLFLPIVEEIGIELFRLMVANSASEKFQEEYERLTESFSGNFVEGFNAWGGFVGAAGWGKFDLLEYEPDKNHAVIQVVNPWELAMQKSIPDEARWGCPFLLGRIIGIFKNVMPQNCWATDHYEYLEDGDVRLRLTVYASDKTINDELDRLRKDKLTLHEQKLQDEIKEKTAEIQKSNRLLENIANLDFLTNLNNRRSLEKKLSEIKDDESWNDYILVFIDLDQFKIINDTCGHLAGDRLLTIVGERLITSVNKEEHYIYRYGGDEFTILLNMTDTSIAVSLANRIRKAISNVRFEWDGRAYQINCSIGLIPLHTIKAEPDNAIIAADNACYQAKKNGRNQIYISEKLNQHVEDRLSEMNWVHKIKEAIEHNKFELHFQLIKPLYNNKQIALEALIRMVDDNGDLIMPINFLPAAENYDVIFEVDCWVINDVFKKLQNLSGYYNSLESVAINLSGNTLSNPKLEDFIRHCFNRYQIDASKICFELTETHMMMNLENATTILSKLRKHGCSISLDDFGAGMSSFGYLRDLPIDKIKIDGGFVKNMHESMVDYTFVESITNVARAMGIKTVAEFVENERIVELLTDISVDYVQGYHIGKPHSWDTIFPKSLG
ncbi:MAG: putative bifunctional diguanylate cyclase/phosphodiesterase [Cellvibrionaceae bacterium]